MKRIRPVIVLHMLRQLIYQNSSLTSHVIAAAKTRESVPAASTNNDNSNVALLYHRKRIKVKALRRRVESPRVVDAASSSHYQWMPPRTEWNEEGQQSWSILKPNSYFICAVSCCCSVFIYPRCQGGTTFLNITVMFPATTYPLTYLHSPHSITHFLNT